MKAWVDEYGPIFHMRLLTAHVGFEHIFNPTPCLPDQELRERCPPLSGNFQHMLLQILVVSDPKVATELLHMPKIMDKNRQALVTLDSVSARLVHAT